MKVVVGANVVIKWFIGEEDSLTARSLLGRDQDLVAPEHVLAEVGQALWRHFREGEVTRVQIRDALMRLPNFVELVPLEEVAVEAADMACEIAFAVYDCLYVAAAVRNDTYLVTADDGLLSALSGSPWAERARSLRPQ